MYLGVGGGGGGSGPNVRPSSPPPGWDRVREEKALGIRASNVMALDDIIIFHQLLARGPICHLVLGGFGKPTPWRRQVVLLNSNKLNSNKLKRRVFCSSFPLAEFPFLLGPVYTKTMWKRYGKFADSIRYDRFRTKRSAGVYTKTMQGRSKMPSLDPTTTSSFFCRASTTTKRHQVWTGTLCASNTLWFDRCFQMYR